MQTVTTGYRQAVQQFEQRPATRVRVDWDRNGVYTDIDVGTVTVERTIVSDLPSEVTLIAGVATATASVELTASPTDPTKHPGLLYSPYQTTSPLYGVDVEGAPATVEFGVQVGESDEYLTQLVGRVRDLNVSASPGGATASVQLVDGRQDFRFAPVLPLVIAEDPVTGLSPGLDALWFVSTIARQAGYDAVPPLAETVAFSDRLVILSATLHGSATPDPACDCPTLTSAATSQGGPIQFGEGAFAAGTVPDTVDGSLGAMVYKTISPYSFEFGGFDYLLMEMWCKPSAVSYPLGDLSVAPQSAPLPVIHLGNDGANYVARFVGTGTVDVIGPAVTSPSTWHYVAIYIHFSGNVSLSWNIDGTITAATPFATVITAMSGTKVTINTYNSMEAVQVVRRTTTGGVPAAGWSYPFTPTAVLESPLSALTATPAISPTADAWSIIQDIAKATAGIAMLDERGVFQFWNRRHFGTASASTTTQRTIRASMPITGIQVQRLNDRIRNVVQVAVTPYQIGIVSILWALSDVVQIAAHGSLIRDVDLSPAQAYQVSTNTHVYPGGGPTDGRSGYRAARKQDGTGGAVTNLVMTVTPFAHSITVRVDNPNPWPVWLVSPTGAGYPAASNGLPAMCVLGRLITQAGTEPDTLVTPAASTVTVEYRDELSIAVSGRGERPVVLDASVWLQNSDDALNLAQEIGFALSEPAPTWPPVAVVADPALQVGDRVWVVDDSGQTGINDPAWIVGITTRVTGTEATQDLMLRPVAPPGAVILGDADRGTLDGRWSWA